MTLIDLDELRQFPLRAGNNDREHGNEHFIFGVESVLEYAESLPTVKMPGVVFCDSSKYIIRNYTDDGKDAVLVGNMLKESECRDEK